MNACMFSYITDIVSNCFRLQLVGLRADLILFSKTKKVMKTFDILFSLILVTIADMLLHLVVSRKTI